MDQQLIGQLVDGPGRKGCWLTGEGGLLGELTKRILESAAEGELDDHLGYGKHDPAGRDGGNSRNGVRTKQVLVSSRLSGVHDVHDGVENPPDRRGGCDYLQLSSTPGWRRFGMRVQRGW